MDPQYKPQEIETNIYHLWVKGGYFTPKIIKGKKPYSILLPLPNANDPMHMGHALFTIQDILIRYHRMLGVPTLWLPGGDHAGIETQYVFEKKLAKNNKSRFDYDRAALYQLISDYVEKNKDINRTQMKRLGFSLDWSRYHYSLEPAIVETVLDTFRRLHADKLVYRAEKLVNFCPKCGTAFSDLEIKHMEKIDPLYYMKYGPFVLATVRPETKFGDTALAVNPIDKRYQKWIGREVEATGLLGKFKIKVIADDAIDPQFGTGVAKVTPAHDFKDFEIAQRHKLGLKLVIDFSGRLTALAGPYAGLKVKAAREKVASDLQAAGLIDHIDQKYTHTVATCYRCSTVLEPLPLPQWYIKTKPLAAAAIKAVKDGTTKIAPLKRFEKMYFDWLENILDWNISRQIVWGPRIPVYYCLNCNQDLLLNFITQSGQKISGTYRQLKTQHSYTKIIFGLQSLVAPITATYSLEKDVCQKCTGTHIIQETDTFDTWFLSGQWPLTTLGFPDSPDFKYFYPTTVLDTLWDILFFWVARMMMLGIYRTGKVPFKVIHLHARVVDKQGAKMSKSRNNVLNPLELVDKYGADALRMALVFGVSPGTDIAISEDKVRSMRNFTNKVWNIARFIITNPISFSTPDLKGLTTEDKKIILDLKQLITDVTANLENYRFDFAAEALYHFLWHRFADEYLESAKDRIKNKDQTVLSVLGHVFLTCLKLLHPFMPFVTEAIWAKLPHPKKEPLIISQWPTPKN